MSFWSIINEHISEKTGQTFNAIQQQPISGGCINTAYSIEDNGTRYFVKLNKASGIKMFEAESAGLQEIRNSDSIRAPLPVCTGLADNHAYLVMEYLPPGTGNQASMEHFGLQLAKMHQTTKHQHGWHIHNTIGSTPQINTPDTDWTLFWQTQRLGYQLKLAAQNGYRRKLQDKGERLMDSVPVLLNMHKPVASLLHGDLWSGNYSVDSCGQPVIFDPAVYYGDRETDIAMTELFGGFPPSFYRAYDEVYPLEDGYPLRRTLYNLYHILNHLNLFGGGYLSQAEHMINQLLSEIR